MTNTGPTTNVKQGPLSVLFPGNVIDFTTLRGNHDNLDPYSGFSVCSYTGDNPMHYDGCIAQLASTLGVNANNIIQPRQTHGTQVLVIDENFISLDTDQRRERLDKTDALVTTCRHIAIGVNTADCVPILLYAHGKVPMVAAIHAGWRGTLAEIATKAVKIMLDTNDADCIAAYIGVSICRNCFEVGDEVANLFVQAGYSGETIFRNHDTGKAHIDLQEINRRQLANCGIHIENIFTDNCCSRHDTSGNYFSARRMGVNSGRTFTGIMLL